MVTSDAQTGKELGVMLTLWEAKRSLASASGGGSCSVRLRAPQVYVRRLYDRLKGHV